MKEVKRIEAAIQSPDVDSLEELNELNEDYEALPQIYRLMVKGLEVFNSKFDVAVKVLRDGAYTLSELGGSAGTIGSWGNQVLTMKDNMEGTFIYKMTKTGQSGNHIHSFTLFYNGAEAGNGVRLTFQINNNLTINGTKVPMENVQPDVEYYYLIIARLLKEITPNVIFATTTPVNPKHPHNKNSDIQRFNALVVPHLQAMGIQINDLHALVAEDIEGNICEDLIHLSAKGIELCSQQVVNEIKKCL